MRHRWGLYSSRKTKKTLLSSGDVQELIPVSVEDLDVAVTINGLLADVTCRVRFRNNEAYDADCFFLFALDRKSAMYKCEAFTRGRVITGQCMPKKEEDDSGPSRRRVRFDESSADMFSCGIGHLASKDAIVIAFQYATELCIAEDGGVKFIFPTFIPRAYQKGFVAASSEMYGMDANIGCRFRGAIAGTYLIDEIFSKELLQVEYIDGSRYQAKLALVHQHDVATDVEFTVIYKDIHLPHIYIETPVVLDTSSEYYMMQRPVAAFTFYNRVRKAMSSGSKGEYILAIDRSGSMRGVKMQNARETLLYFLKSLPHGCYFNVISFGSTFQPLFPRSRIYNQHNVRQALRLQMKMGADLLGTEILPMLKYIMDQPYIDQHMRQVFLLTDGAVSNTREVLDYMWEQSASGNTTRIFTFGIGESASRPLLLGLARAGNGRCQFLKSNERPYSKVLSALRNAMQPCLTDLELHFKVPDGVEMHVIAPGLTSTLFAEESLTVYCLITGMSTDDAELDADCTATLVGKQEGQPYSTTVHFSLTRLPYDENMPVHRLAVRAAILDMERGIHQALGAEDILENEYEILLASQACNIASSMYTQHVGIDSSTGQPIEMDYAMPVWSEELSLCKSSSGVDLHIAETGSVYRSRSRLSLPRTENGFRNFVKSIFPSSTSTWSLQGHRVSQQAPTRDRPTLADIDEELAVSQVDLNCSSSGEWEKFKAALLEPRGITQFQQTDGSWQLTREVAYALGTTEDSLRKSNPLRSGAAWTTVICLVWLRTHFLDRMPQWAEEQEEGNRWLSNNAELEGYRLDELNEIAESVISSVCHLRKSADECLPPSPGIARDAPGREGAPFTRRYARPSSIAGLDSPDGHSLDDDSLDNISNMYDGESLYRYEIFNLMETHTASSQHDHASRKAHNGEQAERSATLEVTQSAGSAKPLGLNGASDRDRTRTAAAEDESSPGSLVQRDQSETVAAVASQPCVKAAAAGQPPIVPRARATAAQTAQPVAAPRMQPTAAPRAKPAIIGPSAAVGRGERRSVSSTTFSYRSAQTHSIFTGSSSSDWPHTSESTSRSVSDSSTVTDSSSLVSMSPKGSWRKKFTGFFFDRVGTKAPKSAIRVRANPPEQRQSLHSDGNYASRAPPATSVAAVSYVKSQTRAIETVV